MNKTEMAKQILSDGRWHRMSDIAKAIGETQANVHQVVNRVKGVEYKMKVAFRTRCKYAKLIDVDTPIALAKKYPGVWGQLYWST